MLDRDLHRQLSRAAVARLESGTDVEVELPVGVRILDSWHSGEHAAVLFWADRELDLWGFGQAVLQQIDLQWVERAWHARGGGAAGTLSAAEILVDLDPGLHRLGGSSCDPVRLTHAMATPEVATIERRSTDGAVSRRTPGVDGFCLLGTTHSDAITYVSAVDPDGLSLPSEPLLL
jgi:hypothetical protein